MKKTNIQLVEYSKAQLGKPYWFGTFGQIASVNLLNSKAKQYPKYYGESRIAKAKKEHIGKRVHDCMGLVKGFIWSKTSESAPTYKASEDWSADAAFEKSTEKGAISSIPEIVGICVRYKGHVGVYIGGGEVIEARGFDYGVVKTKLNSRKWTHWYKHPLIEYTEKRTEEFSKVEMSEKTYQVKSGDTLSKIARNYKTTIRAIVELNGIENPNLIKPGQVLRIPSSSSSLQKTIEGIVATNASNLNVRSEANTNSRILRTLPKGTKIKVQIPQKSGFYKLADSDGYVSSKYINLNN